MTTPSDQEQRNRLYPERQGHPSRGPVSFTYERIEWTWVDGGVTAVDDRQTPAP